MEESSGAWRPQPPSLNINASGATSPIGGGVYSKRGFSRRGSLKRHESAPRLSVVEFEGGFVATNNTSSSTSPPAGRRSNDLAGLDEDVPFGKLLQQQQQFSRASRSASLGLCETDVRVENMGTKRNSGSKFVRKSGRQLVRRLQSMPAEMMENGEFRSRSPPSPLAASGMQSPPVGMMYPNPNLTSHGVGRTGSLANIKSSGDLPISPRAHALFRKRSSSTTASCSADEENQHSLGNQFSSGRMVGMKLRATSTDSGVSDLDDVTYVSTFDPNSLEDFDEIENPNGSECDDENQQVHLGRRRLSPEARQRRREHKRSVSSSVLPTKSSTGSLRKEFSFTATKKQDARRRRGGSGLQRRYTEVLPALAREESFPTMTKVGSFSTKANFEQQMSPRNRMQQHRRSQSRPVFQYKGVVCSIAPQADVFLNDPACLQENNNSMEEDYSSSFDNIVTVDAVNALIPKEMVSPPPQEDFVFKFALWEKKKKGTGAAAQEQPQEEEEENIATPPSSSEENEDDFFSRISQAAARLEVSPPPEAPTLEVETKRLSTKLSAATELEQKLTDSRDSQESGSSSGSSDRGASSARAAPPSSRKGKQNVKSPRSGKNVVENRTIRWSRGKKIGNGTYGEVFVALDCDSGKQFAVKRITAVRAAGDSSAAKKIEMEIQVMRDLVHENIVQYIGSQTDPETGVLEIFLEYVTGGSLADLVKNHGALGHALVSKFTRQICQGVMYLHSRGCIHRDIKGANILISDSGIAKLADFGCSKQLEMLSTHDRDSTLHNIRGSIPWMSPEMIRQSGHNFASDIWSFGATVLEMASGKFPWPDLKDHLNALFVIGNTNTHPPMPDSFEGTVLKDFLLCCFRLDPKERATAVELLDHPFIAEEA